MLPAVAQDAPPVASSAGQLSVELNDLATSQKGCKLTFVTENTLPQSIDKVSFEVVLFDRKGLVERMAVLDFRDLPEGKTKVRQFDLSGTRCEDVGGLLLNDSPACTGAGLSADACMKGLKAGSKVDGVSLKG
ncbi:hypothetical protein [Rhizobium sp. RU20A]|uniref:hypothetical protein n=1 Tax=Rhizobium sp. RU20A TaxID=1907412 RepID=UPI001FCEEB34|nr:hypothetical protein [Rhizobium sp. RU20A]